MPKLKPKHNWVEFDAENGDHHLLCVEATHPITMTKLLTNARNIARSEHRQGYHPDGHKMEGAEKRIHHRDIREVTDYQESLEHASP